MILGSDVDARSGPEMAAGSRDPRAVTRKKVPLRLGAAGAARGWRNEKEGGPSLGGRPPAIRSIATRFGLVEMLPSLGEGNFWLSRKPGLQADLRRSGGRLSLDLDPPTTHPSGGPATRARGEAVREERGLRW